MGPDGEEDRLISFFFQILEGLVFPKGHPRRHFDPEGLDGVDLLIQNLPWETIIRDTHGQHPPRHGELLEDMHLVSLEGQVIRTGQSRGTRADNGHLLLPFFVNHRYGDGFPGGLFVIRHETFQGGNGNGLVHLPSPEAHGLTGMAADPAANGWEREFLSDNGEGFVVTPLRDESHVFPDVQVDRAGNGAGGIFLVNHVGRGNGLGIIDIDGGTPRFPLVVFAQDLQRAVLGAKPATRAFLRVDPLRVAGHCRREVARFPLQVQEVGMGDQLDVGVPCHLHQLG